jgi:hypothetical protein
MATDAPKGTNPWYTEEKIRSRLVEWLHQHGYFEPKEVGMQPHKADDDLIVESVYGMRRRISVRGFPGAEMQEQARARLASAVLDLSLHRNEGTDVGLALALPAGHTAYTTLVAQLAWLRTTMPFTIYWVAESGDVGVE